LYPHRYTGGHERAVSPGLGPLPGRRPADRAGCGLAVPEHRPHRRHEHRLLVHLVLGVAGVLLPAGPLRRQPGLAPGLRGRPGAGGRAVVVHPGRAGPDVHRSAVVAAAARWRPGGLRCAPGQWLHLGPRHLRPGLAAGPLAGGGADLHGHRLPHRERRAGAEGGLSMRASQSLSVLLAGALFGFGLALSTMVQPQVVLSFLQFRDWGLMLVMGGAMGVTLLAYRFVPRWMRQPLFERSFGHHVSVMERDTLVGAAVFGIGWGPGGVCAGPAIAGRGTGNLDLLWALAGIFAGAWWQGVRASR